MERNIFSTIRKEEDDFFNTFISPMPGYDFNQYETVKRCALYHGSKFEDATAYLGRDKLFFNVVNPACEVATKMLNVDTKNIRLWPLNPKSHFSTYLLEKELKTWLKTSEFAETLNKIAEELPIYGSVFLEKTKKGAEVVDVRRLMCDQAADRIEKSRFVTTVHYMTPSELRETGWDDVDVAIDRFGTTQEAPSFEDKRGDINIQKSSPLIKIWKRYGEVPEWWIDGGKSDKMVKSLFIVAGSDQQFMNQEGKPTGEKGVVLFKSKWHKEWPYKDFHYTKIKGRLLGVGVIEMLFDVQVRVNELKNQKRLSMEISSLHLFQTPDKQIVRNILTDLQNGDMLISPNGITPIANEERNLSAFKDEEASYLAQADKLTFAYEAVRGDQAPSSTPLGVVQIATAQASSVFAFKRENLCIDLREFFNELVMPQALNDLTKEHVMRFLGTPQELMKLDEMCAELQANEYIKNRILNGQNVTKEEIETQKQAYMQQVRAKYGSDRFLKIKNELYADTEFEFDFIIDNEQADPQLIASNLQKVITDLASNPGILQDPRLKLLYFKFAEKIGISQAELDVADGEAQQLLANQQQNGPTLQPTSPGPSQQPGQMDRLSQLLSGAKPQEQTAPLQR